MKTHETDSLTARQVLDLPVTGRLAEPEIQAAFRAAVRNAHSDHGGDGDAGQLVAARDQLLKDPAPPAAVRRLTAADFGVVTVALREADDVIRDIGDQGRAARVRKTRERRVPAGVVEVAPDPDGPFRLVRAVCNPISGSVAVSGLEPGMAVVTDPAVPGAVRVHAPDDDAQLTIYPDGTTS